MDAALAALKLNTPVAPGVNKDGLEALYEAHKNKTQGKYTDESWVAFGDALADALKVLLSEDVRQDDVNNALTVLKTAIGGLTTETTGSESKSGSRPELNGGPQAGESSPPVLLFVLTRLVASGAIVCRCRYSNK